MKFSGERPVKTVTVLMSVYNGEKYLQEQVDSIIEQEGVAVRIVVRDDGSSDKTVEILDTYVRGKVPFTVIKGENIGAAKSFLRLVKDCERTGFYYAFSDQDDVWEKDKLITAVHALEISDYTGSPMMYCSRLEIVDEKLNHLGFTSIPKKPLSFSNALVETVTAGGTILLNREAFDLLAKSSVSNMVMHDSWVYLTMSAFGKIYYDDSPKILYRQHSSNVFGGKHGFVKRWALRFDQLVDRQGLLRKQAVDFSNNYQDHLDPLKEHILSRYLSYRRSLLDRIMFALSPTVYRQKMLSSLYMRILILLGKL